MKNPNIVLLTAPIRSGKTTAIQRWLERHALPVNGILCPDRAGIRCLIRLDTGEIYPFELAQSNRPDDIKIGRFLFSKQTFDIANDILRRLCKDSSTPIIIDEIGKLEWRNEGFEPALSALLSFHLHTQTPILIVVRDTLLDSVIEKYTLQNATILAFSGNLEWNPPFFVANCNGLVLAGGSSRRMNQDKALLHYHQKPQYRYLYDLLRPHCTHTFVSAKSANDYPLPLILDAPEYANIGPLAGLFSAFCAEPETAWLILAIDYPLFSQKELLQLLAQRNKNVLATVFYHPETQFFEPFLGLYEPAFFETLKAEIAEGNFSLQKILKRNLVQAIVPENLKVLKSIDTPEEYREILGDG